MDVGRFILYFFLILGIILFRKPSVVRDLYLFKGDPEQVAKKGRILGLVLMIGSLACMIVDILL